MFLYFFLRLDKIIIAFPRIRIMCGKIQKEKQTGRVRIKRRQINTPFCVGLLACQLVPGFLRPWSGNYSTDAWSLANIINYTNRRRKQNETSKDSLSFEKKQIRTGLNNFGVAIVICHLWNPFEASSYAADATDWELFRS